MTWKKKPKKNHENQGKYCDHSGCERIARCMGFCDYHYRKERGYYNK